MADIYSLTIRADTRDVTRAKQALDGMSSGAIKATKSTDNLAGVYSRLDKIIELTAKGQKNAASVTATLAMEITKASQRVQALTGAQEESERQSRRQFDLFEQLRDGTIRLSAATGQYSTEYERLLRQINPAFRASQDFKRSVEVLDAELARGTISLAQYNDSLRRLQGASTAVVRRGFAPMRGAIQQAGFQVGDFAVQVGAGQSALIAFAQQGSQLAGIFGPGGAVIGAVIAIGGAIAGGFARSMGEGGESVEELAEKTKELTEELGRATDAQARFVRGQFAQQAAEQRDIIKEQTGELDFLNIRMERMIKREMEFGASLEFIKNNQAYQTLAEEAEEAQVRIDNANAALEAGDLSLREYEDAISGGGEEAQTAAEKLDSMIESLQVQADVLGLSARETALYGAARLGANAADIEAINNSFDLIETYRQQEQARKSLIDSTKIGVGDDPLLQSMGAGDRGQDTIDELRQNAESVRNGLDEEFSIRQAHKERVIGLNDALRLGVIESEEERARLEVESARMRNAQLISLEQEKAEGALNASSTIISATSSQVAQMGELLDEAGAAGQAFYILSQGLAAAGAIVQGLQASMAVQLAYAQLAAATANPTLVAAGTAHASVVASMGFVTAGLIAAQTVAEVSGARMHGGSVSAGGRYLVGENGPEIVTMGGSGVVTPSSVMGTGEPSMPNITVNMIEDNARSGHVEQRRRDDGSVEINAFVSDITSGGRRAKVMESVYGLRRQGR